jgi:hypothetical protein
MALSSQQELTQVKHTIKTLTEYITAMRIEIERKKLQSSVS